MEVPLIEGQDAVAKVSTATDPKELVKLINQCVRESDTHKTKHGYHSKMEKYDKLYKNKLYDGGAQGHLYFESRANYYRKYVDGMANLLTREKLTDTVLRRDDAISSISAEVFNRIIEYVHYYNKRELKEHDWVIHAGKYGNGIMHVYYNPEADENQGLPVYEPINPKYIGVSPGAKSLDEAVFVFYKRPVSTASLQQSYPDLDIKSDSDISSSALMNQKESGKFKFFVSDPNNSAFMGYTTGGTKLSGDKEGKKQTWLTTFYYKDPEKVDLHDENELLEWIENNPGFGNKSKKQSTFEKLKLQIPMTVYLYPHGRKIQKANDYILEDDPCPYPWLPFVDFGMFTDPDEVWAEGIISLIRESVRNIHLASSSMAANVDFRNRPPFWTTSKRWDNNQSFQTEPNQIIPIEQGAQITPLAIPPVAGDDVLKLIHFRVSEIEGITGVRETMFGQMPSTGAPSGIQLDKLQNAALGAILPIFTRFTYSRKAIGERILWMIQNYMTSPRKMRFINNDDNPPTAQPMGINQPTGNPNVFTNDVMSGDWEYYVDETTGRPFSQEARFNQMKEAAAAIQKFAPADAAKLLLESTQLPGWSKFASEIDKRYQMQLEISITNAERDRQLKEFIASNKAQADERKAEAMEVKSGAFVKGMESKGIKDLADAIATGNETMAREIMDSETTPLAPTPTVVEPPAPPTFPDIGQLPGAEHFGQPKPLEGGMG